MRTILLSAVLLLAQACSHKSAAEEEAAKWADTLYPGKPHTQMCVAKDTDGDGYVSCTVASTAGRPSHVSARDVGQPTKGAASPSCACLRRIMPTDDVSTPSRLRLSAQLQPARTRPQVDLRSGRLQNRLTDRLLAV